MPYPLKKGRRSLEMFKNFSMIPRISDVHLSEPSTIHTNDVLFFVVF